MSICWWFFLPRYRLLPTSRYYRAIITPLLGSIMIVPSVNALKCDGGTNPFCSDVVSIVCQHCSHAGEMTDAQRKGKNNPNEGNDSRHKEYRSYKRVQRMGGCMVNRPANDMAAKGVAYRDQRCAVFVPCLSDYDWCRHCTGRTPSTFRQMFYPCLFHKMVSRASSTGLVAAVGRLSGLGH